MKTGYIIGVNTENQKTLANLIDALSAGSVLPFVPPDAFWQVLFRRGDQIAFKASIEARAVDVRFIHFDGNKVQVPVADCVNARFYLNPIMNSAVRALEGYGRSGSYHGEDGDDVLPSVKLNHESTASFRNLRFEYDEDEDGNKFSGVQGQISQLKLFQSVGLPYSALLYTGGKSIHWILSVDGIETAQEHRLYQLAILARLPGRVDPGSLSGNYPSWIPGSRREKDGVVSEPRVYATGKRIDRAELDRWIAEHPIKNPAMLDLLKAPHVANDSDHRDEELECAIHAYIVENGIEVAHENHEKVQIHCLNHQDRSASAYIFKNSGYVGCSSCGGEIDWVRVPGRKSKDEDTDCPKREQVDTAGAVTFSQFIAQLALAGEDRVKGFTQLVGFEVDSLKDAWKVKKLLETFGVDLTAFATTDDGFTVLGVLDRPVHRRALLAFFDELKQTQILSVDTRIALGGDQDGVMEGVWKLAIAVGGKLVPLTPENLLALFDKGLGRSAFWVENWYGFTEEEKRKRGSLKRPHKWTRHKARRYQLRSNGKLGPVLDELRANLTDEDRERERWKQQELGKLVRTSRGKAPGTKEWVEGGVSLEYLAETNPENLGSLPNFRALARIAEGSKRPVIAKVCKESPEGRNRTLIDMMGTPSSSSASALVVPAGWGKTTFAQDDLPHKHGEYGYQSVAICRERVRDALLGEEQANNPKDGANLITSQEQFTALAAQLQKPGDVIRVQTRLEDRREINEKVPTYNEPLAIGVTSLDLISEDEPGSQEADQEYLVDRLDEPVILSDPETRKPILARVGYSPDHCLKSNPPDKAPRSFCKDCPFTQCRSNPKNTAKIVTSPFVITTHAGFLNRSGNVHRFKGSDGNKDKRDLVIFDEKPQVFEEFQIEASKKDGVPLFDNVLIPLAEKSKDSIELVQSLRALRQAVAKMRDNALQSKEGNRLRAKADRSNSYSVTMLTVSELPVPEGVNLAEMIGSLENLAWKGQISRENFYSLLDSIRSLRIFGGKVIAEFDVVTEKLTLTFGHPIWHKFTKAGKRSIVLDATAHLDPDYSLSGAPDLIRLETGQRFPNLTFHPSADFDLSKSKATRDKEHADGLIKLVTDLAAKGEKVLVVTDKGREDKLREQVREHAERVFIDHFGNLKGDNRYRECQHIVFAFTLRWPTASYLARALWLFPEKAPVAKQWRPSMDGPNSVLKPRGVYATSFRDSALERLRIQIESIEVIQAIMRTRLRTDVGAKVDVWLPSSNAQLFGALLDYFAGATVIQSIDTR